MNQYIITEEELLDTRSYIYHEDEEAFIKIERNVRSHPYQSERDKVLTEKRIDYLRSLGWMVAVHNDYKQNGEFHTFWLLTYPDGKYLKGEGKTDDEALEQIVEELRQAGEP